jgi:hypothetical protein
MNSAVTLNAPLQAIAALLIFVAVYLALVLCTIACLVAAVLMSEHVSVVQAYGVRSVSLDNHVLSELDDETETRKSSRQRHVCRLSDCSKDATKFSTSALVRNQGH